MSGHEPGPGRRSRALDAAGRVAILPILALCLALAGGLALYLSGPTTLTVAVAPAGGPEPALVRAYADILAKRRKGVRLKVLPFDGVSESAMALQDGHVDLAVVRPDVSSPANGLTLAVLREQALVLVAPSASGIKGMADLAGRRVAVLAGRTSDIGMVVAVLSHYGLTARVGPSEDGAHAGVTLVPLDEDGIRGALADGGVQGVFLLTTPSSALAARIVARVREASPDGKADISGVSDRAGILARQPGLQSVSVPAGLFAGSPPQPAEEVPTIGATYRLMARADLSRSLAAEVTQHLFEMRPGLASAASSASGVAAPPYDSTVAATSSRLPIHPGAIDYYEREQESFVDRYETWIYLVAFLGGGFGSALAWLRQRLSRVRRHRIDVATERLLEIRSRARRGCQADALDAMETEIDDLAAGIARQAMRRPAEARTMEAARIALESARSTVRRGRPSSRG